ncbi:MAG: mechanosensitive ion channel family protein [Candidatus Woesearchaeota archaeon]
MVSLGPLSFLTKYDLLAALVILALSFVVSKLVNLIVAELVHHFAKRTKTTLDDEILHAIKRPIFFSVLLLGLYLAVETVSFLAPYKATFDRIAAVLGIAMLFYALVRVVNGLFHWYTLDVTKRTKTEVDDKYIVIVKRVLDIVIYIIAALVILRYFGVEITPILASLGIGGLAVALALQDTLANFFAGFYTLTEKSIRVGDFIELENGLKGYVDDITWRTTRIKTLTDNFVIIPNSKLAQSVTTNYSLGRTETAISIPVGISYDSDLEAAEKVAMQVAKDVQEHQERAVKDHVPSVRFTEFGESTINFNVNLKVRKYSDQFIVRHEFIKQLKKAFEKKKLEFAFPTRIVYIRK